MEHYLIILDPCTPHFFQNLNSIFQRIKIDNYSDLNILKIKVHPIKLISMEVLRYACQFKRDLIQINETKTNMFSS